MDLLVFLIYLSACFTAAATGALFPTGEWYKSLDKPIWTPPDWVFPIAWAIYGSGYSRCPCFKYRR